MNRKEFEQIWYVWINAYSGFYSENYKVLDNLKNMVIKNIKQDENKNN